MTKRKVSPKFPGVKFESFEGCRFCKGRPDGCIGCRDERKLAEYNSPEAEAAREAAAAAELNKHLLFSAHIDNPEEMATLAEVFSHDALVEAFDDSDITDEEVLLSLGHGSIEKAEQSISTALAIFLYGNSEFTREEAKRVVIDEHRTKMAQERAVEKIKTSLQNKPGSNV